MAGPDSTHSAAAAEIPDYVGHYLDTAFTHAVRRNLGIPRLVDAYGRKVRVKVLSDWKVVRQDGIAHRMVFEVEAQPSA